MKRASSKFQLLCLVALALLSSTCLAQQNFALSDLKFNGFFGTRPGDGNLYCLLGNGFFRTISSGEDAVVISDWRTRHPNARAVPVSISGEDSRMRIVYIWAVDGSDNLNLLLINKGVFPATVMLDAAQFDPLLKRSAPTPEQKAIDAGMSYVRKMRHVAPAVEAPPRRLISEPRYLDFLKDLLANENVARTQMNGIWSDKFNELRQEEHTSPLHALPLSGLGISEK